jgi:hypothetical protein
VVAGRNPAGRRHRTLVVLRVSATLEEINPLRLVLSHTMSRVLDTAALIFEDVLASDGALAATVLVLVATTVLFIYCCHFVSQRRLPKQKADNSVFVMEATAVLDNIADWSLAKREETGADEHQWMELYTQDREGLLRFRIVCRVRASMVELFSLIREVDLMPTWNRMVSSAGDSSSSSTTAATAASSSSQWRPHATLSFAPFPIPAHYVNLEVLVSDRMIDDGSFSCVTFSSPGVETCPPEASLGQEREIRVALSVAKLVPRLEENGGGSGTLTDVDMVVSVPTGTNFFIGAVWWWFAGLVLQIFIPYVWGAALEVLASLQDPSNPIAARIKTDRGGFYASVRAAMASAPRLDGAARVAGGDSGAAAGKHRRTSTWEGSNRSAGAPSLVLSGGGKPKGEDAESQGMPPTAPAPPVQRSRHEATGSGNDGGGAGGHREQLLKFVERFLRARDEGDAETAAAMCTEDMVWADPGTTTEGLAKVKAKIFWEASPKKGQYGHTPLRFLERSGGDSGDMPVFVRREFKIKWKFMVLTLTQDFKLVKSSLSGMGRGNGKATAPAAVQGFDVRIASCIMSIATPLPAWMRKAEG